MRAHDCILRRWAYVVWHQEYTAGTFRCEASLRGDSLNATLGQAVNAKGTLTAHFEKHWAQVAFYVAYYHFFLRLLSALFRIIPVTSVFPMGAAGLHVPVMAI